MGAQARSRSGAITGINVTPLVDITLVLLIVFMVTAKLIAKRDALGVDLPRASRGEQLPEQMTVVLTAQGAARVNGELIASDEDILPRVRAAHANNADVRVTIAADGRVRHERVMRVLDLLKDAGVAKVGFGVVPSQEQR